MPLGLLGRLWIVIAAGLPAVGAVGTVVSLEPGGELAGAMLRMTDRLHGWSVTFSGALLRTQDGGRTWKKIADVQVQPSWGVTTQGDAWDLQPGASVLLRASRDGQIRRWPLPCSGACRPAVADFDPSGDKGLLFGLLPLADEGPKASFSRIVAYRTSNGGRTWTAASAPDTEVYRGQIGAYILGDGHALVFPYSGCDFFISTDLGGSWQKVALDGVRDAVCAGDDTPYSIQFVGDGRGWLRTDDGWILRTGNGGASWVVSSLGKQPRFPATDWVGFADERHGLLIVAGRLLETVDGGEKWTTLAEWGESGEAFQSVSCAGGRCVLISDRRIAEYTFGG